MFRFVQKRTNLILGQHAFFPIQSRFLLNKLYSTDARTFESIKMISPNTIKALDQEFKYKKMTQVQEKVLELLPAECDLLVRAKTGTGKTLAFLIAALETALARRNGQALDGKNIPIMIISPTRELALQIAEEARRLVRSHGMKVGVAVGGTNRGRCFETIERSRVDILVGTPGRVIDILKSSEIARKKVENLDTINISKSLMILDEADRLLEMGFKEDIEMIASFLPNKKQSFLFSATISNDVKAIAQKLLLPGHKYIDTVPENEEPTHLKIKQSFMISPHSKQLFLLYQIIRKHMEEQKGGKIIVFFPTTKVVALMTEIFSKFPGLDIIDMHSQLTQYTREKKSDRFRRSTSAIMFTSDVSARGVDYPGVSLVVQMGAPSNRDSYIHRVGRTGRAGKEGEGILILSSFEEKFMDQISDIPIKQDYRFEAPLPIEIQEEFRNILSSFSNGHRIAAYMAMANYYYHGCNLKLSGETVLALSRDFARGILGLAELPTLPPYLAARLSSGRKNSPRMDQSSALYAKYKNITRESNDRGRDFKHDRGSGYDRGFRGYDRGKSENGFRGYDRGKSENGFRGYDRGKSENGFRGYDRGKNENGFRGYDRGKSDNGFRGYDRGKSDNGFSERIKMKGQYNF